MAIVLRRWMLVGFVIGASQTTSRPALGQFLQRAFRAVDQIPDPLALGRDVVRERTHEWRLERDQARFQADINRGDINQANRDLRKINTEQYFVDRYSWQFQRDSLHNPGPFVDHRSTITANSTFAPQPRSPATAAAPSAAMPSPRVAITVGVAGSTTAGPIYSINGTNYSSTSGDPRSLQVESGSTILYDRGGSFGMQRYSLTAGPYEFRPSAAGWALYKLP